MPVRLLEVLNMYTCCLGRSKIYTLLKQDYVGRSNNSYVYMSIILYWVIVITCSWIFARDRKKHVDPGGPCGSAGRVEDEVLHAGLIHQQVLQRITFTLHILS